MAKITVEKVFRNDTKKDGSPYLDKYGKPYTLTKVLCEGRYFTVWGTKPQLDEINVGSVLEGEIKEGEFNGQKTYSFTLPKPDPIADYKKEVREELDAIWDAINELKNQNSEPDMEDVDPEMGWDD